MGFNRQGLHGTFIRVDGDSMVIYGDCKVLKGSWGINGSASGFSGFIYCGFVIEKHLTRADRLELKTSRVGIWETKKRKVAVEIVCLSIFKHNTWFISWTWDVSKQNWMLNIKDGWTMLNYWINQNGKILGFPSVINLNKPMIFQDRLRRLNLLLPHVPCPSHCFALQPNANDKLMFGW